MLLVGSHNKLILLIIRKSQSFSKERGYPFYYLFFKLIHHACFSYSRPVVAPVNGGRFLWQRGEPVKTNPSGYKHLSLLLAVD